MHLTKSKLVDICADILILKMEENIQHFCPILLYYFKKSKNATEYKKDLCKYMHKCTCAGAVTD